MGKRIEVRFSGGYDSILYSVKDNRFYSYEREIDELHARYGGRQYYSSRSGLSGAGFLEVDPANNDLIIFGYYRTDACCEQHRETVHLVDGQPVFGYAPIISHEGIDNNAPFVLTDGSKVAFVSAWNVRDILLGWKEIEGKEIELTWYDQYGYAGRLTFQLYNPDHFRGVRATRFIDLRYAREQKGDLQPRYEVLFERKLNICTNGSRWFHLHIDGFLDLMWDEDPRQIVGEIVAGWQGTGDGLYWRRGRTGVEAFIEIPRASLNGGKYVVEGETSEWIDYEENFSVLEWFSKEVDEWKEYFRSKLLTKARQDYVYARQRAGIDTRRLMEQNREVRICVQDSLDVGNCPVGTQQFIEKYRIEADEDGCTTIGELLDNEHIDEMLRNFAFQKVIHHKLVDPDKDVVTGRLYPPSG